MLYRLTKSIVAAVIYPIATIFSIPKMIRIYRDREIQTRHFTRGESPPECVSCCNGRYPDFYRKPPQNIIQKMKLLVTTKYNISLSYLRSQVRIHLLGAYTLAIAVPVFSIATPIVVSNPYSYDNEGQLVRTDPSQFWIILGGFLSLIPSIYGFLRTLLGFGNDTYFISAVDEITYPFKKCFTKNPSRLIDRLIVRKNRELGTRESLDFALAKTNLPILNQEFNRTKAILTFLDNFLIDNKAPIDKDSMNLVKEYVFSNSLIFSSGKSLNPNKLKMLDDLVKPKFSLKEESEELEISSAEVRVDIPMGIQENKEFKHNSVFSI